MKIEKIDGIGLSTSKKLNTLGIRTTNDVRNKGIKYILNIKYLGSYQLTKILQASGFNITQSQIENYRKGIDKNNIPKTDFKEKTNKQPQLRIKSKEENKPKEDFELNQEFTKPTQFVESDPMNDESLQKIILLVDWEDKTVNVKTRIRTNSQPSREFHHLDTPFEINPDMDATKFKDYYDSYVKPLIQEMGNHFETKWNGSNYVGTFNYNEDYFENEELEYSKYEEISHLLMRAPEHDYEIYFNIRNAYPEFELMIKDLKDYHNIDLLNIDIKKNIDKIIDAIENDSCIILQDEDSIIDVLKDLIDEYKEDSFEQILEKGEKIMDENIGKWEYADFHIEDGVLTILGDKQNIEKWSEKEILDYIRDATILFKENKR